MIDTLYRQRLRRSEFSYVDRITWAARVHTLGYWAVRQAALERGATMQDIAWILVTTLKLQGVN